MNSSLPCWYMHLSGFPHFSVEALFTVSSSHYPSAKTLLPFPFFITEDRANVLLAGPMVVACVEMPPARVVVSRICRSSLCGIPACSRAALTLENMLAPKPVAKEGATRNGRDDTPMKWERGSTALSAVSVVSPMYEVLSHTKIFRQTNFLHRKRKRYVDTAKKPSISLHILLSGEIKAVGPDSIPGKQKTRIVWPSLANALYDATMAKCAKTAGMSVLTSKINDMKKVAHEQKSHKRNRAEKALSLRPA
mmetsp:Transcript_25131/g.37752  ORF Transcript_25131/g.37752 Transcript_25131/m.37752 type:complete len:250 (+) Transcript_25131:254-1003(+)